MISHMTGDLERYSKQVKNLQKQIWALYAAIACLFSWCAFNILL